MDQTKFAVNQRGRAGFQKIYFDNWNFFVTVQTQPTHQTDGHHNDQFSGSTLETAQQKMCYLVHALELKICPVIINFC